MTDEQRPWGAWPEYVQLGLAMQKAHEYDSPSFLRADVDVALDALCARILTEADAEDLWDKSQVQKRADAAEAQRDRLASVLEDVLDWIELDGTGNRSRIIRNARAALADVREEG